MIKKSKKSPTAKSGRWLIVQTLVFLPLTALLLRILGFKRSYLGLNRLVSSLDSSPGSSKMAIAIPREIAATVTSVNRTYLPCQFSCLPESLTLWFLLRRRKIAAELRLGVRTLTGPFESHAWVEYNRTALNDIDNIAKIYEPFDLSIITTK